MRKVHLTAFDRSRDLPVVAGWLRQPHVVRWWGHPEQTLIAIQHHPPVTQAMITADARPVGYLCWQRPTQEELAQAGLTDMPGDLMDIDIMIGEPDALGQGIGPAALGELLDRLRGEGVLLVGLAAANDNRRALRAYTKAGFRHFRDFQEAGQDMHYLVQRLSAAV